MYFMQRKLYIIKENANIHLCKGDILGYLETSKVWKFWDKKAKKKRRRTSILFEILWNFESQFSHILMLKMFFFSYIN